MPVEQPVISTALETVSIRPPFSGTAPRSRAYLSAAARDRQEESAGDRRGGGVPQARREEAGHQVDEHLRLDGLRDVRIEAGGERAGPIVGARVRRDGDRGQVRVAFPLA